MLFAELCSERFASIERSLTQSLTTSLASTAHLSPAFSSHHSARLLFISHRTSSRIPSTHISRSFRVSSSPFIECTVIFRCRLNTISHANLLTQTSTDHVWSRSRSRRVQGRPWWPRCGCRSLVVSFTSTPQTVFIADTSVLKPRQWCAPTRFCSPKRGERNRKIFQRSVPHLT